MNNYKNKNKINKYKRMIRMKRKKVKMIWEMKNQMKAQIILQINELYYDEIFLLCL